MKLRKSHLEIFFRLFLFLLSFLIRIINIERGNYIVWDESHFNKFSKNYLLRQFYFDVHPPLGKLLNALAGYMFNQDLECTYESADLYPEKMDYVNIRRFNAFFGAFIPIFAELILKEFGFKYKRFLFALFFIFENGFVSISRLILLDSYLLFFTAASVYLTVLLKNSKRNNWKILSTLGFVLGCVLSIKWIGAFVILLVGFYIIYDLCYTVYKDEYKKTGKNFIKYFITLIIIPVVTYIFYFIIHFKILNKKSNEISYVNSLFRYYFEDKTIYKYVDFGKPVNIKANGNASNYLHSHNLTYPDSTSNQITGYFYADSNNKWIIQKVSPYQTTVEFLKNGDEIALYHLATKKYLTLSYYDGLFNRNTTRADGVEGVTDRSIFIVELQKDLLKQEENVKNLTSYIKLRIKNTNQYLQVTNNKYPNWGGNQNEVVFTDNKRDGTIWTIETTEIDEELKSKNEIYKELRSSTRFLPLFIKDLNIQMFKINNSFEQDIDEEPPLIVSKPYEWFILKKGLRMVNWDNKDRYKFYMFGNPVLWYLTSISIFLLPIQLFNQIVQLRAMKKKKIQYEKYLFTLYITLGGFILHYIPFFYINRVLYFHHYYPAYFFGLLNLCVLLRKIKMKYLLILTGIAICSFILYSPLTYGIYDPKQLDFLRFVKTWNY